MRRDRVTAFDVGFRIVVAGARIKVLVQLKRHLEPLLLLFDGIVRVLFRSAWLFHCGKTCSCRSHGFHSGSFGIFPFLLFPIKLGRVLNKINMLIRRKGTLNTQSVGDFD